MATIPGVSDNELIRTTWGDAVADELNLRCVKADGTRAMTGYLTLPAANPSAATHAAHRGYVDQVADGKVSVSGDTMTGYLTLPAANPSSGQHATHKNYVDTKLSEAGGTMTGSLLVHGSGTGGDPNAGEIGSAISPTGVLAALRNNTEPNVRLFKSSPGFVDDSNFVGFYGQTVTTVLGALRMVGTSGVELASASDYRLKDDLGPIVEPLERVMQLQPKHLRWKSDQAEFDGFIAHELDAVVPDAVSGDKDAEDGDGNIIPQMTDTKALIPLLTAALQEAVTTIADLTARIEALEAA